MRVITDRRQETAAVKQLLKDMGYKSFTVTHDRGTAYGWLVINVNLPQLPDCQCTYEIWGTVNRCPACGETWNIHYDRIKTSIAALTGRAGEHNELGIEIHITPRPQTEENTKSGTEMINGVK